jgi:hypothetical protein
MSFSNDKADNAPCIVDFVRSDSVIAFKMSTGEWLQVAVWQFARGGDDGLPTRFGPRCCNSIGVHLHVNGQLRNADGANVAPENVDFKKFRILAQEWRREQFRGCRIAPRNAPANEDDEGESMSALFDENRASEDAEDGAEDYTEDRAEDGDIVPHKCTHKCALFSSQDAENYAFLDLLELRLSLKSPRGNVVRLTLSAFKKVSLDTEPSNAEREHDDWVEHVVCLNCSDRNMILRY